jgi:hypothetical protein
MVSMQAVTEGITFLFLFPLLLLHDKVYLKVERGTYQVFYISFHPCSAFIYTQVEQAVAF